MMFDTCTCCARADVQLARDLTIGMPVSEQFQDGELTRCQDRRCGRSARLRGAAGQVLDRLRGHFERAVEHPAPPVGSPRMHRSRAEPPLQPREGSITVRASAGGIGVPRLSRERIRVPEHRDGHPRILPYQQRAGDLLEHARDAPTVQAWTPRQCRALERRLRSPATSYVERHARTPATPTRTRKSKDRLCEPRATLGRRAAHCPGHLCRHRKKDRGVVMAWISGHGDDECLRSCVSAHKAGQPKTVQPLVSAVPAGVQ